MYLCEQSLGYGTADTEYIPDLTLLMLITNFNRMFILDLSHKNQALRVGSFESVLEIWNQLIATKLPIRPTYFKISGENISALIKNQMDYAVH